MLEDRIASILAPERLEGDNKYVKCKKVQDRKAMINCYYLDIYVPYAKNYKMRLVTPKFEVCLPSSISRYYVLFTI